MKINTRLLLALTTVFLITLNMGACATKEKKAEGPSGQKTEKTLDGAAEQAAPSSGKGAKTETPSGGTQTSAQSESTPSADELAVRERERKADMERQKQAEAESAATEFKVEKLERVYFDFDKFSIKPEFRDVLAKDAETLKNNPTATVVIEGHCDERGSAEYNLALGERRAASAKKYLVSLGINDTSLKTTSYGEEQPADGGHDEKAWSQNRRVQFSRE